MSTLAAIAFFSATTVAVVFWLLFFVVVKVRIADRDLTIVETSDFGFLLTRWPHDEMRAYLASLAAEEKRRLVNRFLRRANAIFNTFMAIFIILVIAMMVLGA
ncbi:hypothetical protein MASR1M8_00670 [Thermomonas brevis]